MIAEIFVRKDGFWEQLIHQYRQSNISQTDDKFMVKKILPALHVTCVFTDAVQGRQYPFYRLCRHLEDGL